MNRGIIRVFFHLAKSDETGTITAYESLYVRKKHLDHHGGEFRHPDHDRALFLEKIARPGASARNAGPRIASITLLYRRRLQRRVVRGGRFPGYHVNVRFQGGICVLQDRGLRTAGKRGVRL